MKACVSHSVFIPGKMPVSAPAMFLFMLCFIMVCGLFGVTLLGRDEAFSAPEPLAPAVDEQVLKMIMHRNVASTAWPQAYHFVLDENDSLAGARK